MYEYLLVLTLVVDGAQAGMGGVAIATVKDHFIHALD
jgi:hypothetical protein